MLRDPIRIDPISFIKLLVYFMLSALLMWIALVLLASNLWGLQTTFIFRNLVPTLQINELYQTLSPALNFVFVSYGIIMFTFGVWSIWQARKGKDQYALERKYAINYVGILTQCIVLINVVSAAGMMVWYMLGLIVLHTALFIASVYSEPLKNIINLLPQKKVS